MTKKQKQAILNSLRTIGRAPIEQHSTMLVQLLNSATLGDVVRAAREHRTDPQVGNVLLALKAALLNPPPHALEQLGAQAE